MTHLDDWPELAALADRYGVSREYWDWQGHHVVVPVATVQAVLGALDVDATTEESVRAALAAHDEAPWRRLVPVVTVARAGRPAELLAHVPHGDPLALDLLTEDGAAGRRDPAAARRRAPRGRWRAHRRGAVRAARRPPDRLPHGPRAAPATGSRRGCSSSPPSGSSCPPRWPGRCWGLMTQLYSVRSRDSWGIGDFGDLARLASWGADQGADFVLVNPLHAAEPVPPVEDSPYLPTSRRFLNPIYVRVADVPEVAALDAGRPGPGRRARRRAGVAGDADDLLDRQPAYAAKLAALDLVHRAPRSPERERALAAFREREGEGLHQFAVWCALAEHHASRATARSGPPSCRTPPPRRSRRSPTSSPTGSTSSAGCSGSPTSSSRPPRRPPSTRAWAIGLMTDLAVGVHPSGAEVWTLGPALARGLSVGAPPDAFNQIGQDWSQPPWRPDVLAELGYEPYRAVLRAALRHAGGLRIDHVMGLFRLWCIPDGASAADGRVPALRPRGDGLDPAARGRARRRLRGRRGPRRRRAVRARPPRRARRPRHLDPVVRGRRRAAASAGDLARAVPGHGHHPRPAADRRLPARRARPPARVARPAHPPGRRGARGRGPRARGRARGAAGPRAARRRRRRAAGRRGAARAADAGSVPAARRAGGRPGRRPAYAEPAGHPPRVPQLAGPALRPRRPAAAAGGPADPAPRPQPRRHPQPGVAEG